MKLLLLLLLSCSLFAETIDPSLNDFKIKERETVRVDRYEFPGTYDKLENIDIDASRKMRVELDLSGAYPLLKKINYFGTFGTVNGKLTGAFPQLDLIDFHASNTQMKLDLNGKWEKNCTINLKGGRGQIELILPKDIALVVNTKVGLKGRVINHSLKKKGKGILKKTYINPEALSSPIELTLNIEVSEGKIILN
jgi:hypothetical protein